MKINTVKLRIMALSNAAEMIRSHPESGWTEEDFEQAEMDVSDENEYKKQCIRVYEMLEKEADRLRIKYSIL